MTSLNDLLNVADGNLDHAFELITEASRVSKGSSVRYHTSIT